MEWGSACENTQRVAFSPARAIQSSSLASSSSPRGHLWSLATWHGHRNPPPSPSPKGSTRWYPASERPGACFSWFHSHHRQEGLTGATVHQLQHRLHSGDPTTGRTGISMWKHWLATLLGTLCTWVALGLTASGSRLRSAREAAG